MRRLRRKAERHFAHVACPDFQYSFIEKEGSYVFNAHVRPSRDAFTRHSWLTKLGFHPRQIDAPGAETALMIPVDPDNLAAAQLVINAVESADADGFPSFWDKAHAREKGHTHHRTPGDFHARTAARERSETEASVIGWHPLD